MPLVISCEHAGNRVPASRRGLFEGAEGMLASHRGWDAGALELARGLARRLAAPLIATTTTRLLVDANRSASNPRVFSGFTAGLGVDERRALLAQYHAPHWQRVAAALADQCEGAPAGCVVHLSVHSFTPVWKGQRRQADIGLLYDPSRRGERAVVTRWIEAFGRLAPSRVVRRNQPYRGTSDGLTRALRRELPDEHYVGIELEVNQKLVRAGSVDWRKLQLELARVLAEGLSLGASTPACVSRRVVRRRSPAIRCARPSGPGKDPA